MAGEVALEQSGGVASGLAFGDPSCDVVLGRGVVLAAVQDNRVQRAVELPVAAAAEPVAGGLATGSRDRRDAGQSREGGLGAEPDGVGPGDEQLRGNDRADAGLVEQLWCERAHVNEDLALELSGFDSRRFDPAGKAAQDKPGRTLVGCTAVERRRRRQRSSGRWSEHRETAAAGR